MDKDRTIDDVLEHLWRYGKRGHFGKTENMTIKEDVNITCAELYEIIDRELVKNKDGLVFFPQHDEGIDKTRQTIKRLLGQ